ncbi:hypothetical protein HDV00_002708 [Rhizophlyctis rosea]|nr:hypothetical protein HDV00_002708 [Rhizophlyctis rosea]
MTYAAMLAEAITYINKPVHQSVLIDTIFDLNADSIENNENTRKKIRQTISQAAQDGYIKLQGGGDNPKSGLTVPGSSSSSRPVRRRRVPRGEVIRTTPLVLRSRTVLPPP